MEKKDLKTGMVVETRDKDRFLVIMNVDICGDIRGVLSNYKGHFFISDYDNNLISNLDNKYDIVRVFEPNSYNLISIMSDSNWLKIIWERKEEKPQLTERERAYLKAYSYDYEWIARDDDDCLTFFKEKPVKKTNGWYIGYIFKTDNLCIKDLFSFIKWEDEEPYNIKDLLGEE